MIKEGTVMAYVIQLTSYFGNDVTNEPLYDRFFGYYAADGRACEQVTSLDNAARFETRAKAIWTAQHSKLRACNMCTVMSETRAAKFI